MDRRQFLKLLGISAAGAVLVPPKLLTENGSEVEVVELSLLSPDQHKVRYDSTLVSGFILHADPGRKYRAVIRSCHQHELHPFPVHPMAFACFNDPEQIVMTQMQVRGGHPCFVSPIDAAVFRADEPVPVDVGRMDNKNHPLEIEYEAFGQEPNDLYLGLFYRTPSRLEHPTTSIPADS